MLTQANQVIQNNLLRIFSTQNLKQILVCNNFVSISLNILYSHTLIKNTKKEMLSLCIKNNLNFLLCFPLLYYLLLSSFSISVTVLFAVFLTNRHQRYTMRSMRKSLLIVALLNTINIVFIIISALQIKKETNLIAIFYLMSSTITIMCSIPLFLKLNRNMILDNQQN